MNDLTNGAGQINFILLIIFFPERKICIIYKNRSKFFIFNIYAL